MNKYMRVGMVAALLSVPVAAWAAQKPVSVADVVTATFTIEAIDHATRTVTLKDKDGISEDLVCGPDVKRFDALKVGDKVTFRYHESLVSAIRRPGSAPKAAETGGITRTPGTKPGGTIAQQMSATVTIEAIDAKVPSVTVKAADGRRLSFRIEDKKNLEGYKAGDKVEITYTQALAINVEAAGK
jgi:Cu/Ag efflux protein CusF